MAEEKKSKFTHIGLSKTSKRKIALLAQAQNVYIYELAEYLIDQDWERAVKAGMVTEAVLEAQAHWVKAA